jgi:hypothetical protein
VRITFRDLASVMLSVTLSGLLASALVGCVAPRPPDEIAARFQYRVPFDAGTVEATAGNSVEVTEVWGTRKKIEIGGEYVVVGHYMLQSVSQGRLFFWLTADNWDNSGPTMDLQRTNARPGTGRFVLQHKMEGPGRFHVRLYDDTKGVADMYFHNAVMPLPPTDSPENSDVTAGAP